MSNLAFEKEGRHEIKFVAPELELYDLICWVKNHPAGFINEYPERRVNNIYFDSFDYQSYWESHSGVSSRTKVRYRWYGDSIVPGPGALEIKCKKNLLGLKQIYPLSELDIDESYSWRDFLKKLSQNLPSRARTHLTENPMPVLINRYRRKYFVSPAHAVRITLDSDLVFFDQRFKSVPNYTRKTQPARTVILEIKFGPLSRDYVSNIVKTIPLNISRCSKYVSGIDVMRDE